MTSATSAKAFAFHSITKKFGAVLANKKVTFSVEKGTIHGVVGENGAGKSTIMKLLYGMYQPDDGEIELHGSKARIKDPNDAIRRGIGMVHQHFMLVPTLSIWENVILGSEPTRFVLKPAETKQNLDSLQRDFGFSLDLDAAVENLSVGQQQQVEIMKLLYRNAEILILDEPTAVLTPQEVTVFFERLKALWNRGKTIVLISHKLKEILAFTQFVTVMRRGEVVGSVPTDTLNETSLAELIIGRKVNRLPDRQPVKEARVVLEVQDLTVEKKGRGGLHEICFQVRAGEIVGVAGVEGNGQGTLVECLAGVQRKYKGSIAYSGKVAKDLRAYALKQQGLALIPPDRHRQAVILDFSVKENFALGQHWEKSFSRGGIMQAGRLRQEVLPHLQKFDVRPQDPDLCFSNLSGGNQQKVVIARELCGNVACIVAAHPTRGVDIGAIEFIHKTLIEFRDQGAGVLLISSELDEILALSDRILVLYEGRIAGETVRAQAEEGQIGRWMTGGRT